MNDGGHTEILAGDVWEVKLSRYTYSVSGRTHKDLRVALYICDRIRENNQYCAQMYY